MNTPRRRFLAQTSMGVAALATNPAVQAADSPPAEAPRERPLIVSTWPFGKPANDQALKVLQSGGTPLDAVEQGIRLTESDPEIKSVGLAGLPNAAGVVQLDACIMSGPGHRAGSVAALEGIRHPISAARRVMERTPHVMLVGECARMFALDEGLESVEVNSADRHAAWRRQRAASKAPPSNSQKPPGNHDTIALLVLDANGDIAGGCSTSGLSGKLPGRVGDSPIIGAGQYCDNEIGAAGSTGRGESNIKVCGGFLTVEHMRRGMKPTDACLETLKRVVAATEPRLLDARGQPKFGLNFYAVNKRGEFGSASLYPSRYAAHDGTEAKIRDTAYLFART